MWVLNKRIKRNLFANKFRWTAILFLVILCVYMVITTMGEATIASYNHAQNFKNNKARDGRFTALAELYDDEIKQISELGFDIEKEYYLDYQALGSYKLRAFRNRKNIDLVFSDEGRPAETSSEMLVEKHFCENNDLHVGDTIKVAGIDFVICGIGGSADAEYVFDIAGATTDHKAFGNCFVTDEGYERLRNTGKMIGSEVYRYGYKKTGNNSSESGLEKYLRNMTFDDRRIKNRYFIEMLDNALETKVNIENAMKDIKDACKDLRSSSDEFDSNAKDMCKAADQFNDVVTNDLVKGIADLSDGAKQLCDNSAALNDGARQVFDYFLSTAESSLAEYGINVDLTPENYSEVLRSVDLSSTGSRYAGMISDLLSSLQDVDTLCNGVNSYTSGVGASQEGAAELSEAFNQLNQASDLLRNGISQYSSDPELGGALDELNSEYAVIDDGISQTQRGAAELSQALASINSSSGTLRNGADSIFDLLLGDVSSRISQFNSVSLNRDNYESVLSGVRDGISATASSQARKSVNELIEALDSYNTFRKGLSEYIDGVGKLYDGIQQLNKSTPDLIKNSVDLADASHEFAGHTAELKNGVNDFSKGITEFDENIQELDDYFDVDVDIIESFEPLTYNAGIQNTADGNMRTAIACGIVAFMIISFIFTVFISHEIDNESAVIGALYSMGVKKSSLIKHYILIPMIISFIGGIAGTVLGLSPFGVGIAMKSTEEFYSLPAFVHPFEPVILLVGIFVPVLISFIITVIIINKKLSKSPLSMLRHEKKLRRIRTAKIDKLSFINSFRLKQLLNELVTSIVVFIGMLLPLTFLMLFLNYGVSMKPLVENTKKDITFSNMCVMKYAPEKIPDNSEEVYIETLQTHGMIGNCDITVVGIKPDSECFRFNVGKNRKNALSVGSGTARKYHIKEGDTITLYSPDEHRYYTFEVDNVVDFSIGLYVFMDIDDMRDCFGTSNDYYNTLVSNGTVDIEQERLFAFYSKDSLVKTAELENGDMFESVCIYIGVSAVIFVIITYLMIKLMIDRASMNISLFKIFGYGNKEIKKMYIDGNFYLILVSAVVSIPVAKIFVDKFWFPLLNANIDIGFDIHYSALIYLIIFVSIILLYLIISNVLKLHVNKIKMSEVLKNRE